MGYDVEFIQVPDAAGAKLPASGKDADALIKKASPLKDAAGIRTHLLTLEGSRPGPGESIDYMGKGLNYARLEVEAKAVEVENNCGAAELLKIYRHLLTGLPGLLIHDLQSGQVHDADSFAAWWSRPL
ncbi:MAG: hypothetical protein AMXMBFR13_24630 [Phycisphaerae bacterium]